MPNRVPASAPPRSADLLARIERIPVSRPHYRLAAMGGLGIAFDGMDGSLVSYLLPSVTPLWHLEGWQTGLLGSSLLIGVMIGALGAGLVADRFGRRRLMMYALALYSTATAVAAFAPSWEFFFVARIVAGIGVGAEAAVIPAYVAEFVPGRVRGVFVGSVSGFFSLGYLAAALLGVSLVSGVDHGWRIAQLVTAAPVLMLLWWRRTLPESPRWLIQQGRLAEAEHVISALETEAVRATGKPLPTAEEADPAASPAAPPAVPAKDSWFQGFVRLWRGGMARRTAVVWLMWISVTFSYYGFFTWIPSLLVAQGMTMTKSFTFTLLMVLAQMPGYYSASFLGERLDRTRTIAAYLAGAAVAAWLLSQAAGDGAVLTCGILLSFFMNGVYAVLYAYTSEIYPTAIRVTGSGTASAFGRIGGIAAPIIIGVLHTGLGFGGVFTMIMFVLAAGAVTVLFLGVSTRGRTLEDLEQPQAPDRPGPEPAGRTEPEATRRDPAARTPDTTPHDKEPTP
ncbi:MFS transporter [Streptomyces sp. NPDC014734]|uniref:MFS transporter n=1 Tax=Streptomyces sp. NPDC014734 TaxID=3364886 RepID=UPI00370142E5